MTDKTRGLDKTLSSSQALALTTGAVKIAVGTDGRYIVTDADDRSASGLTARLALDKLGVV